MRNVQRAAEGRSYVAPSIERVVEVAGQRRVAAFIRLTQSMPCASVTSQRLCGRGTTVGAVIPHSDGTWRLVPLCVQCLHVATAVVRMKRRSARLVRRAVFTQNCITPIVAAILIALKNTYKRKGTGANQMDDQSKSQPTITTEQTTTAEFLERWLDQIVSQRNKPRTEQSYREMVRLHIAPLIGRHQLTKLHPEHVQGMMKALSDKGLSARTVQYARAILRQALNQALKWNVVARNAAIPVEPPRIERAPMQPLTLVQAKTFLQAVRTHRFEMIYRVALSLGLRRGEILGLLRSDVNLETMTIMVSGTLQRVKGKLVRSTPKTAGSIRTLPIPPTLMAALRAHLADQQEQWPDAQYLFLSTAGTPIEPMNLRNHFKKAIKEIGLPATTRFHDLRHSCATFLIAAGEHPRVIMQTLGHSQISTTMDVYGHVLEETHRQAVDRLDALLAEEGEDGQKKPNEEP